MNRQILMGKAIEQKIGMKNVMRTTSFKMPNKTRDPGMMMNLKLHYDKITGKTS